jgi:hypothetical protein
MLKSGFLVLPEKIMEWAFVHARASACTLDQISAFLCPFEIQIASISRLALLKSGFRLRLHTISAS